MNCNWSVKKLGDLVKFTSGGTPSKSNEAYWGGDIPWISASSMDSTRYSESDLKVTTEGSKNGTRLVPKDTVLLLVRGGALHNKIPVGITTREVTFNQDVKALVPKTDEITPWYLLFWLISIKKTLLAKVENTGIGAGKLDTKILQELEVPLPPQSELKRLEKFCKALDDKIILNSDTNQTLEQMAQAIFKSWFVDFDPVKAKMNREQPEGMDAATASLFPEKLVESELGLIPDGWEIKPIKDLCSKVQNGGTPKRSESSYWDNGDIPWLTSGEVRQSIITSVENRITQLGLDKSSAKWVPELSTLVALYGATAGEVSLTSIPLTTNQAVCALMPKKEHQWYNYLQLKSRVAELAGKAVGSAQQNISKGLVESTEVLSVPESLLEAFNAQVENLFKLRICNLQENVELGNLRDTLLPKLLSGEIELDVAEINTND
ncbi:TPA: restriction endonuclease subunit S [Vibrio vulnificus]